ncbi:MAG: chitobiase/beta-hexosaminidase C-terminal domain-containing protein [Clostridiales bacterium]|nr:chitobiase/beta-hexosaminidase C-terminal domain-containing protein [Clostridiales bacterium]
MSTTKRTIKKAFAIVMSALLIVTCGAFYDYRAFAEDTVIGTVNVEGGETRSFTDLDKLVDYVDDLGGKTFTIDMLADWGDERMVIENKSRCTINMHGHMYNRGLTKYKNDGEVICIHDYARVTINGGTGSEAEIEHKNINTYDLTDGPYKYYNVATKKRDYKGGLIAGGYSSNGGGGIDITGSGATLNLNDVTIAGCRAAQTWGTDGYGGGIWIHGGINDGGTINMNNSSIEWCFATNDGGGIYQSNHDYFTLSMENGSHIDHNFAGDDGGGICVDGETVVIKGDNNEKTPADKENTISFNECGDYGGGINIWNDGVTVRNLTIEGNHADIHGGGIYTLEEGISLTNLKVINNTAQEKGGGIYVYNDGNTISGNNIKNNFAYGKGGGVYIEDYVDSSCYVAGNTVVDSNQSWDSRANGLQDNVKIEDDTCEVNFDLGKGANVRVTFDEVEDLNDSMVISEKKGPNCIRYMSSDVVNDKEETYHFTFNDKPASRKIYIVKDGKDSDDTGKPYIRGTQVKVDPISTGVEPTGKKVTGLSGKEYDLMYGYFRHADTDSQTGGNAADYTVNFYYSDGFFDADPFEYNEHLTTASLSMAMAACYLNEGGTGSAVDYSYKHSAGRQFMSDIGCEDESIYVSDLNTKRPGSDTMGVTIASKEIETADGKITLIPIAVRSIGYEAEWASNFTLGEGDIRDGEAKGFSDAAEIVINELNTYIDKYGLEEKAKNGEAAFWVVGYSRGGATANLTAKRIREKYQNSKLFAYTFATPKGGSNNATKLDDEEYFCIHNIINAADLIPHVGMGYMGFVRYGVDHFVPGSEAGEVQRIETDIKENASGTYNKLSKAITYRDNEPYKTNSKEYIALRDSKMLDQLKVVDSGMIWDDYFYPAYITTEITDLVFGSDYIKEVGRYGDYTAEDLMDIFMGALEEYIVPSRDDYALNPVKFGDTTYDTYQKALRDVLCIVFGTESDTTAKMMDKLDKIMYVVMNFSWSDLFGIYDDVLGEWGDLSGSDKEYYSTVIWDLLDETGIFDVLEERDQNNLREDWPTLMDLIFTLVDADYNNKLVTKWQTMELLGTLAYNSGRVLYNHYPEVELPWCRAQDSYYDNEKTEYTLKTDITVGIPKAVTAAPAVATGTDDQSGTEPTELREISTAKGAPTRIYEKGTVSLDVPDTRGEAIYYTVYNRTLDKKYDKRLYNGGIDLYMADNAATATDFEITTYARKLGGISGESTYYVKLFNGKHKVTLDYSDLNEEDVTLYYKEGEDSLIMARPGNGLSFEGWTATDGEGRDVTDLIFGSGDESEAKKKVATISLPVPDESNGFSEYYEIIITPKYGDRLNTIEINGIAAPTAGEALTSAATLTVRKGNSDEGEVTLENVPVTWTYEYNFADDPNGTVEVLTGGKAYAGELTYRATLNISIPDGEGGEFADKLTAKIGEGGAPAANGREDRIGCRKNKVDGSVTIAIVYPPTASEGEHPANSVADLAVINVLPWDTSFDTMVGTSDMNYNKIYYADPDTVENIRINAPVIDDTLCAEEFNGWGDNNLPEGAFDSSGDTIFISGLSKGEYDITAEYIPIVKNITAYFYTPTPGRDPEIQGFEYLHYEINNINYYVGVGEGSENETVDVIWTPTPSYNGSEFDYDTEYSAILNLVPDENGKITLVKTSNSSDRKSVKAEFSYDENLEVKVNERDAIDGSSYQETRVGSYDPVGGAYYFTFDRTDELVYKFSRYNSYDIHDITGVEYRHKGLEEYLRSLLPDVTRVTIKPNGSGVSSVDLVWEDLSLTEGPADGSEESVWTAEGRLQLPDHIQIPEGYTDKVTVKIYVNAEDHVAAPSATLPSGSFLTEQSTRLESDTPGAEIKYTTDGSDPLESGITYTEGQEIELGPDMEGAVTEEDGRVTVTLRTIAVKALLNDSAESVYKYTFTNKIELPSVVSTTYNSEPQIIVEDSDFYDLSVVEGSGAELDEEGNVVATEAGEYRITAKIKKGYKWIIPDDGRNEQTIKDKSAVIPEDKKSAEAVPAADKDQSRSVNLRMTKALSHTTDDQIIIAEISPINLEVLNTAVEIGEETCLYTGQPIEPEVNAVKILGEDDNDVVYELVKDTDYEISYEDNVNVTKGDTKAKALVTGKGNFCGTVAAEFTIYKTVEQLEQDAEEASGQAEAAISAAGGSREAAESAEAAAEEAVQKVSDQTSADKALEVVKTARDAADEYADLADQALEAVQKMKETAQDLLNAAEAAGDDALKARAEELLAAAEELSKTADEHKATSALIISEVAELMQQAQQRKTDIDAAVAALKKARSEANAELDKIKLTKYREPERSQVKKIKADAKKAISTAATIKKVNSVKKTALDKISKKAVYSSTLPKPTITKPIAKSKALTANWKKLSSTKRKKITGFQVQIATNKTFTKNAKLVTVKGKTAVKKTIKKLKAGKRYYVRVRTYKIKNSKKYISNWSKIKYVKTKK